MKFEFKLGAILIVSIARYFLLIATLPDDLNFLDYPRK